MEDCYPFTIPDLPKLGSLVEEKNIDQIFKAYYLGDNTTWAALKPLAEGLLNKITEFEKGCLEDSQVGRESLKKYVVDKFLELVKFWLGESNGIGNLGELIKICRMNYDRRFAETLEKLLLDYSLPVASGENIYSSSKDFLILEERPSSVDQDRALSNPVVLDEVFNKLEFNDKKSFRLVTPVWSKETLKFWRKSAKMHVKVENKSRNGEVVEDRRRGISFGVFNNLLEKEMEKNKKGGLPEEEGDQEGNLKFTKHPFQAYQVDYTTFGKGWGCHHAPFGDGKEEQRFWELVGPQIHDLVIDFASMTGGECYDFCKELFLNKCQNLKKLRVYNYDYHELEWLKENESGGSWWAQKSKEKYAENVQSLILEVPSDAKTVWNILFICPNLKVLSFVTKSGKGLEGLTYPTANGEIIKLEELKVQFTKHSRHNLLPLKNYAKMLKENDITTLKCLRLLEVRLIDVRIRSFYFDHALVQCSANLTKLELELDTNGRFEVFWSENEKWFADLSTISFPNLIEFKLQLGTLENRAYSGGYADPRMLMRFDFGTLTGMKKLERLEVNLKHNEWSRIERRGGTQDWVFNRDRSSCVPHGCANDYCDGPILCNNLKSFCFEGWRLNKEDIQILSGWFPKLTFLEAEVKPKHLQLLLENWKLLGKLNIQTEQLVPLGVLRSLLENKRDLEISQHIIGRNVDRYVKMKEHKQRLYFTFSEEYSY